MDVGTALSLQELIHNWKGDPRTPEIADILDHLLVKVFQSAQGLSRVWQICTREGAVFATDYYLSRIRTVEFLALTVVDTLAQTQETLARTQVQYPEWVAPAQ